MQALIARTRAAIGICWTRVALAVTAAGLSASTALALQAPYPSKRIRLMIGIAPIVRIDGTRVFDKGAQGQLVPDVCSADRALQFVDACRHLPPGSRPWGANAFPFGYPAPRVPPALRALNDESLPVLMIEDAEGVRAVEAMAAVPGVDVLFIGVSDPSIDLGCPGDFGAPVLGQAMDRVADARARAGKAPGLGGLHDPACLAPRVRRVARFIAGGNGLGFLLAAATQRARLRQDVLAEVRA